METASFPRLVGFAAAATLLTALVVFTVLLSLPFVVGVTLLCATVFCISIGVLLKWRDLLRQHSKTRASLDARNQDVRNVSRHAQALVEAQRTLEDSLVKEKVARLAAADVARRLKGMEGKRDILRKKLESHEDLVRGARQQLRESTAARKQTEAFRAANFKLRSEVQYLQDETRGALSRAGKAEGKLRTATKEISLLRQQVHAASFAKEPLLQSNSTFTCLLVENSVLPIKREVSAARKKHSLFRLRLQGKAKVAPFP